MAPLSRVPVFLLTGFLGSGKTTLVNQLMRTRPSSATRMAIVVNEFGEVGIDGALLPAAMTRQVELPGGCICCLLNEDLDKTLLDLLDRTPDLEMIVIETTGVAEPLPIEWSLEREPLCLRVRLGATITVVDVLNFESSRDLSPAVDAQVTYADVLVLSKVDQAAEPAVEPPDAFMAVLDTLNPTAPRVWGPASDVCDVLWNSIRDPALPERPSRAAPAGHDRESGHVHGHVSAHDFDTVWLPIEHVLDFEELSEKLESLPGHYVRIKGITEAIDQSTGSVEPRWIAFHRVGTRVSCEPLAGPARGRVVAVGPGIEAKPLAACLDASVVPYES